MSGKSLPFRYRIGDYAKHMGVTPDYLKHYEENGLLDADHLGGGYRFYGFHQSPELLECMRLKSYGVTVREMRPLITELTADAAALALDTHVEALRRRMAHDGAVIAEHERLKAWLKKHGSSGAGERFGWEVREAEPRLFLQHSKGHEFLDDPQGLAILPEWVEWMPVVKSSLAIELSGEPDYTKETAGLPFNWGLVVKESDAARFGLPMNSSVTPLPGGRCFILHFSGPDRASRKDALNARIREALDQMKALGLKPRGLMQMVVLMHARMHEKDGSHERCGFFIVPVEG